jgi:hypothetical protein
MLLKKIKINTEELSKILLISQDNIINIFKDGRNFSKFSEHWCSELYKIQLSKNNNQEGFDGVLENSNKKVSIKTLSKNGIKFQKSKYIGSGRFCEIKDLIESIKCVDLYIICDNTNFPIINFISLSSDYLINCVKNNILNQNGWNLKQFYTNIKLLQTI